MSATRNNKNKVIPFTPLKLVEHGESETKRAKVTPVSAIKSAGVTGPLRNDPSNKFFIQGCKGGVVTAYVQKANACEEAFLNYDYNNIKNDPDVSAMLQINEVISRRGNFGEAMPQKKGETHLWRQFLMIVGEDDNTPEKRKLLADKIIAHLNKNATKEFYLWPKATKFAGDLTPTEMDAMDKLLLDDDVLKVMKIAYPDLSVAELASFPEICENFFTTVNSNLFTMMQQN